MTITILLAIGFTAMGILPFLAFDNRMLRRAQKRDAAIIDELAGQVEASRTVMQLQSSAIYDMACQLHGRAAADHAIKLARENGSN